MRAWLERLFRRPWLDDHDRVRKDAEVGQLSVDSAKALRRVRRLLFRPVAR